MSTQAMASQSLHAAEIWLKITFPQCFLTSQQVKPLKENILQDVLAYQSTLEAPLFTRGVLSATIEKYIHHENYYHALQPGAIRIDLDGNHCGNVSAETAKDAMEMLKNLLKLQRQDEAQLSPA